MAGHETAERQQDEVFMRRAIALARDAGNEDGAVPIGCVIVRDGVIIGEGVNEVAGQHDPTAHAEIVAIRRASADNPTLRAATLYSTLQPCGMCSMASICRASSMAPSEIRSMRCISRTGTMIRWTSLGTPFGTT